MKGSLPLSFFERDTLTVARELLGCRVEVNGVTGRIVETEAYTTDEASHAIATPERGRLMRETSGRVYVYLIYGMYCCLNFTTDATGPGAVLIRALEPLNGLEVIRERRGHKFSNHQLANGPGKLCQAMGIDLSFNGTVIGDRIGVYEAEEIVSIATSSRIGITKAQDLPWRFFIPSNLFVSPMKVSQPYAQTALGSTH